MPNQLHICRTSFLTQSQLLHKCFTESVAHLSRCRFVTQSFSLRVKCGIYVLPNRCSFVTVANMSVNVANMFSAKCCQNVTVTQNTTVAQIPQTPTSGK